MSDEKKFQQLVGLADEGLTQPLAVWLPGTPDDLKRQHPNFQDIRFQAGVSPARDPVLGRTVLKHGTLVQLGGTFTKLVVGKIDFAYQKEDTQEFVAEWDERRTDLDKLTKDDQKKQVLQLVAPIAE